MAARWRGPGTRNDTIMSRYLPRAPKLRSPVLKRPSRWEFSKVQLETPALLPEASPLESNPFFRALCSPIRVDRQSKVLKVPRELLLSFSLFTNPADSTLWLIPNVEGIPSGLSNGYGPNKREWLHGLKKNRWTTVASLDLLTQTSNFTSPNDVNWNSTNSVLVNDLYCQMILDLVEDATEGVGFPVVIRHGTSDLIKCDPESIQLNLGRLQLESDKFVQVQRELHDGMVIRNKKLADTLIKFVQYNS